MASPKIAIWANQPLIESEAERKREQLLRIMKSTAFQNAPLLQKLLEFIVAKSVEGKPEDLNEFAIATQVLGRRSDFDPASDTSVRTQAYRLRIKLKEYYATEGKADKLLVDIPKGHYRPIFSTSPGQHIEIGARLAVAAQTDPASLINIEKRNLGSGQPQLRYWLIICGLSFLAVVLFFGGILVGRYSAPAYLAAAGAAKIDESLARFWLGQSSKSGVVLAFTDPVFLETNKGDLLNYRGGAVADRGAPVGKEDSQTTELDSGLGERAGPLQYEDGFTGTGEVLAVHRLTDLLRTLNVNLIVERSRALSATDLHNYDVVFLGSPYGNRLLYQITLPKKFTFKQPNSPPYLWQGEIIDNSSRTATTGAYGIVRDPQTHVILTDYALFDVFPSPAQGHRIMLLAGLTTTGTQGAATFATSAQGLQQVRTLLGASKGNSETLPANFECLLRVDAVEGLDAVKVNAVSCSSLQAEK